MASCGRCMEEVYDDDGCTCGKCNVRYHFTCSTVKKTTWLGYGVVKQRQWKCHRCRDVSGGDQQSSQSSDGEPGLVELNTKMDLLLSRHEDTRSEVGQLKSLILNLTEELKRKEEKIQDLTHQISLIDQYSRNRNLEICNIPRTKDENLQNIVHKLASKLDIPIQESDIDVVHRLPTKPNKIEPIIVQFTNRRVRDSLLSKRKIVTSEELIGSGTGKVYVNQNLNKYFRDLRYKAKQEAAKYGFRYVWFKANKILVKKNETANTVLTIQTEKDLLKIEDYEKNQNRHLVGNSGRLWNSEQERR